MISNNLNFKCCYFFVLSKSGPVIHSNHKCRSPVWMILKRTCKINEVFTTVTARRSENNNTHQALNLSTNSPFMSRQAGNCKSFTSTHYLADLFTLHRGRSIPFCIHHHIQLTCLSFQVSRPSFSWDTANSKFYLENPRSNSWLRSKLNVTTWVWYPIGSHPFRSMSIDPSIPEIQNVLNLTLKI